jgi:hypothetical protein
MMEWWNNGVVEYCGIAIASREWWNDPVKYADAFHRTDGHSYRDSLQLFNVDWQRSRL